MYMLFKRLLLPFNKIDMFCAVNRVALYYVETIM